MSNKILTKVNNDIFSYDTTGGVFKMSRVNITDTTPATITLNYADGSITDRNASLIVEGGVIVKSGPTSGDTAGSNPRVYSFISEGEGFFRGGLEVENGITLSSSTNGLIFQNISNSINVCNINTSIDGADGGILEMFTKDISGNLTKKISINSTGSIGIGTSPSYGNSGDVLTSQGSGAPPIWAAASSSGGGTVISGNGLKSNLPGNNVNTNYSIALGANAANSNQGVNAIAIGRHAGDTNQGNEAVALGYLAGYNGQLYGSTAIGSFAGQTSQDTYASAFGYSAGNSNQGYYACACGHEAGKTNQGNFSVAVGKAAGNSNQGQYSVAVGGSAGSVGQASTATAIGFAAGNSNQGGSSVAIGVYAASSNQGGNCVAIGHASGQFTQGYGAVAIGHAAGMYSLGDYTIAIGHKAAESSSGHRGNIILNAQQDYYAALNPDKSNAFYVKPIQNAINDNKLLYNTTTGEITYQPDSGGGGGISVYGQATLTYSTTATKSGIYINNTDQHIVGGTDYSILSYVTYLKSVPNEFANGVFWKEIGAQSHSGSLFSPTDSRALVKFPESGTYKIHLQALQQMTSTTTYKFLIDALIWDGLSSTFPIKVCHTQKYFVYGQPVQEVDCDLDFMVTVTAGQELYFTVYHENFSTSNFIRAMDERYSLGTYYYPLDGASGATMINVMKIA